MAVTEGTGSEPFFRLRRFAAALIAFSVLAPARGRAAEAPVVSSVTFQVSSPYPVSYGELSGLVTLRAGDRLTAEAVRESIRGLYSRSVFREVSAFVREEGGKADVRFLLRPAPVVTDIEVRGRKKMSAAQVLAASRIRRGALLEYRDFSAAEKDVLAAMRRHGFTSSAVSVEASCSAESGTGKVRIDVREGDPGIVRTVEFPGASFFSGDKASDLVGVKAGAPYDFRKWDEGVRRLRRAYKKAGFLTVRVADPELSCEEGEGVCLSARVEEGVRYDVRWEGVKRFAVGKVEDASGIYGDEESTEGGLVPDLRGRILAFYRSRDHFRAAVTIDPGATEGGVRPLRIAVSEGEEGYLKRIRFAGNANIPSGKLKKQMISDERGVFRLLTGSGKFREDDWNADLAAVVGLYQQEGYIRARIASVDSEWDAMGGITQTIHVEEGPRYRLIEVRFRGNDHFLKSELVALVRNREGAFVDYPGLDQEQGAIAAYYRNAGYLDAEVEAKLLFEGGKDAVVALFDVKEGPRYRLGTVAVRGNVLTEPVVVLREVTIPAGEPAGEEKLLKFQRAVFGTGLYKTVRIQRVKRPGDGVLDLVVEVEETLFFEVEFGAGYGTDTGARGFAGAKSRNLDGKGRTLSAKVTASQKEQRYLVDLREPWVLGNRWKWEGGLTGSYTESVRESFSLNKTSVVTSISRTIFERSSLALQYELSKEQVFDVTPGAVLSPEDQGRANIAAVRGLFVLDFRDDPFNPKRGSFNSATAEWASFLVGSEFDYVKIAGQSSWYFPVFRRNTLAASGRAGYIRTLRDTVEVPIQKRFFLGGRTTVRGFKEESLGPTGADGSPTGGDTMVNLNVEFRVPLQYGFIVAAFLDGGSVWLRDGPGSGLDMRESAGLGLRYVTPIGPISFDYAWKLDRRPGESPTEWHFTIGAVF